MYPNKYVQVSLGACTCVLVCTCLCVLVCACVHMFVCVSECLFTITSPFYYLSVVCHNVSVCASVPEACIHVCECLSMCVIVVCVCVCVFVCSLWTRVFT